MESPLHNLFRKRGKGFPLFGIKTPEGDSKDPRTLHSATFPVDSFRLFQTNREEALAKIDTETEARLDYSSICSSAP